MKHSLLSLSMLSLLVIGCNQPGSDAALSELKTSNAELSTQLAAANDRIDSLEAEMESFTRAYDSDKRVQLLKNIDSVEQLLNDVCWDTESASATLQEIQALKAEVEKLKDLCVKHEVEASDASQVGGQVTASLSKLEQSVDKLKRSVGTTPDIGTTVRRLESEVRQLESKVRRLH